MFFKYEFLVMNYEERPHPGPSRKEGRENRLHLPPKGD